MEQWICGLEEYAFSVMSSYYKHDVLIKENSQET